jgi:hypothetical protein
MVVPAYAWRLANRGHGGHGNHAPPRHKRCLWPGLRDEEQRKASVNFYRHLRQKIDAVNTRFPGKVIALEMQAAPQAGNASVEQATDAFARSVREIAGWDWSCDLVLEHCDAMTGCAPRKGFLPLEQVLKVVKDTDISVCINWARSAIEGRNTTLPLSMFRRHLRLASLGR